MLDCFLNNIVILFERCLNGSFFDYPDLPWQVEFLDILKVYGILKQYEVINSVCNPDYIWSHCLQESQCYIWERLEEAQKSKSQLLAAKQVVVQSIGFYNSYSSISLVTNCFLSDIRKNHFGTAMRLCFFNCEL